MHFMRLLYWTLFDHAGFQDLVKIEDISWPELNMKLENDLLLLGMIVFMFGIAMHFYTAPITMIYKPTVQATIAPMAIFVYFFTNSWDIRLLTTQVLLMNCYTVWYLVDSDAYAAQA